MYSSCQNKKGSTAILKPYTGETYNFVIIYQFCAKLKASQVAILLGSFQAVWPQTYTHYCHISIDTAKPPEFTEIQLPGDIDTNFCRPTDKMELENGCHSTWLHYQLQTWTAGKFATNAARLKYT